ncbi:DUF4296 domain-containing protein [Niabella drilacis]|uniref:DUF4296 domain-containing protein n=1 Tax=Niabella drilacis (strain DSM 25811 / CCM 8410 / CCUG 62505 / LMG 26954 / E90) TaxID=1285928 RepID=A0A1G7BM68_NIADE|nr:DUF4296 domain-containing protein [Niabella drilacis]SDE28043.1 protein of unknown function [Niabella drilacis]
MNKLLPLLILGITVTACGLGRPKDVLPQDKMQAVLWDIAKGGEFVNGYVYFRNPNLNRAAVNQQVLKQIFTLHKISKKQFDKSLEYYQRKPDLFVAMLDSINVQQARAKQDTVKSAPGDSAHAAAPPPSAGAPSQPSRTVK